MKRSFKNHQILFFVVLVLFTIGNNSTQLSAQSVAQKEKSDDSLYVSISNIKGVSNLKELSSSQFKNKYVLFIEQPLDHKNIKAGTFNQRVFVMNVGVDRPTILVTEGYGAAYASNPKYREELSKILDANIIFVEHRYFLESTPKNADWKYLTAENAANDLHRIREAFDKIYKGKWVATGISKGGQNALIYTSFFPNDVDITVPYVAPFCKKLEDGRHEVFLKKVAGEKQEREAIINFQKEILKRRVSLQYKFDSLCIVKNYVFNLPKDEIYDYSVLEFSFSFWQWGSKIADMPKLTSSDEVLFKYWMMMSSPDYFVSESETTAFFIQAAKELGYYGYDIKPFKDLLRVKNSKGYLERLLIPKNFKFKFDNTLSKRLSKFIDTTSSKVIFVYGEYDPWTAVKIDEPKGKNVVVLIEPKGSHRSRINSLPTEKRNFALELINKWLAE